MEWEIVKWVVLTLFGVAGWLVRKMVTDSQDEINKLKLDVDRLKHEKLSKDDFKEFKSEIKDLITEKFTDLKNDLHAIRHGT